MASTRSPAAERIRKARWEPGGSHVVAASSVTDERTRVLKHGDTFALFDHYGDFKPGGLGEEGLYHDGTRFLSSFLLDLEGGRPFFLNSTVRDENDQLAVALTNPDLVRGGRIRVPLGTLHIGIRKFLWRGVLYQEMKVSNFGLEAVESALWMRPALAKGVLTYLASTQAVEIVPREEAEPGRILHETRKGEMAALREIPFGRYYGSVDATPLFVVLAGAYYERTGDRAFAEELWPHERAALAWMDRHGDRNGDGFLEYERRTPDGLRHQGWRDSDDAVFHENGANAEGAIALCEVQGYAYAAHRAGAALASLLGDEGEAARQSVQAKSLKESFERAFWCEELSTYGMALDGGKNLCRVRGSSAGQCLFAGIASPEHARCLARTLFSPESFSGWGLRTVATSERRYSPLSYHDGSVWPHDNALIARGLARYGFVDEALTLWEALFDASVHFPLQRMPELFCGFPRQPGEGPILYPVACAPQAWSAASVLLFLQVCIGIEIDAPGRRVLFTRPRLPASLNDVRIHNLEVAGATIDLAVVRHRTSVGVEVLRRASDVDIVVVK